MSTFEFSASPRPFASSGIAPWNPPPPALLVSVPTPAPLRLNQTSRVKVDAFNLSVLAPAVPKRTYWLEPLNWSAFAGPPPPEGVAVASTGVDALFEPSTATRA